MPARSNHPMLRGLTGLARRAALARLRTAKKNARGLRHDGKPLIPRNPQLAGLHGKERAAARMRAHRHKNIAAGLTGNGTPRKYKTWDFGPGFARSERHNIRVRSYMVKRYEAGLTARGTPRKQIRFCFPKTHFGYTAPMTAAERAWRELRATMNIELPAATFIERYE